MDLNQDLEYRDLGQPRRITLSYRHSNRHMDMLNLPRSLNTPHHLEGLHLLGHCRVLARRERQAHRRVAPLRGQDGNRGCHYHHHLLDHRQEGLKVPVAPRMRLQDALCITPLDEILQCWAPLLAESPQLQQTGSRSPQHQQRLMKIVHYTSTPR